MKIKQKLETTVLHLVQFISLINIYWYTREASKNLGLQRRINKGLEIWFYQVVVSMTINLSGQGLRRKN